jgi:hypothetical protein
VLIGTSSVIINVLNGTPTPTPTPTSTPMPTPTPTPIALLTITSPASGATVSGSIPIAAQTNSQVIWVNFYINNNYVASSPPYTYSWLSSTVPNGQQAITVKGFASGGILLASSAINVNVQNGVPSASPTATPTPTPTSTPTPSPPPTSTPPIASLTGDASKISGADTNIAHFGTYSGTGNTGAGYSLIGGPLLTDEQAASFVKPTQQSIVETDSTACITSTTADCFGPTMATSNAHQNSYFMNVAVPNSANYLPQLNSFYSAYVGSSWQMVADRIDGACPMTNPTTAEILQWAANKWGINPILYYAEAVQEGNWNQVTLGDYGTSSGVLQLADLNTTQKPNHAFPGFAGLGADLSRQNTCFNADFYGAHLYASWKGLNGEVTNGDIGTAIQSWYQGAAAAPGTYTSSVYSFIDGQTWVSMYFNNIAPPL